MTTNYHNAITTGESNAPATINTRLSQLDGAIAARAAEITALNTSGTGNIYAQINNASGESDTSWAVDNISGTFLAGATVIYTVSGTIYASTVAANTSTTPLTVTAAPNVTIPDNTVITQVPSALVGPTLSPRVNVKAPEYSATGDGTTDDTTALLSALGVSYTTIISGSNTSITVASATAFSNGDDIEITQDDDTIHKTTVSGAPSGNVITLTDALTDTVTAGNLVVRGIVKAEADGKIVELPPGTYIISRPLPRNRSIAGSRSGNTIIKASASFVGNKMLDHEDAPHRIFTSNIELDANNVAGLQHIGSDDGKEGSVSLYEDVIFRNSVQGVYSIGSPLAGGSGNGMFVGTVFRGCEWYSCQQWIYIPTNSDDVLFLSCRFYAGSTGASSTQFHIDTLGKNVRFQNCFFKLGITGNNNGLWWRIQSNQTVIENCFFEEQAGGTDCVSLFYCSGPTQRMVVRNCLLTLTQADPTPLTSAIYYPANSDGARTKIEFSNNWLYTASSGVNVSGLAILEVRRNGTIQSDDFCELSVGGNQGWDDTFYTLVDNTTDGILLVTGSHNGVTYDHRITTAGALGVNPSTSIWLADEFRVGGNMKMATASTLTVADDAVGTFDSLEANNQGLYYLLVPVGNNASFCGMFMGAGTGTPVEVGIGSNLVLSNATLTTSADGTDGKVTISPSGSGNTFKVLNRAGAERNFFLFCLSRIV